jgi:hypothetical protein
MPFSDSDFIENESSSDENADYLPSHSEEEEPSAREMPNIRQRRGKAPSYKMDESGD